MTIIYTPKPVPYMVEYTRDPKDPDPWYPFSGHRTKWGAIYAAWKHLRWEPTDGVRVVDRRS